MKDIVKLQQELEALENRRKELFVLQEPINKELVANYNKMEVLKDKIGSLRLGTSKTVDWKLLLDTDTGGLVYKRLDQELHKRGLFSGGSLPSTKQRCIKVMLTKNQLESYNKTVKAVKEILPFIKPFPDGEHVGYKFIDIFEHTLSAYGSYYMLINEKKHVYKLMQDRHHQTHKLQAFDSLSKIIKYVQFNHPYEN